MLAKKKNHLIKEDRHEEQQNGPAIWPIIPLQRILLDLGEVLTEDHRIIQ
jgi:hypothetical protein